MVTAIQKRLLFIAFIIFIQSQTLFAMVYDNRFLPLYKRPRLFTAANPSLFSVDFFATTTSKAFGSNEETIGIPELFGKFDLNQLANSMVAAGFSNPLRTDLQGAPLPFIMDGKIQSQAVTVGLEHAFTDWLSIGTSFLFMRVSSTQQFIFNERESTLILGPGDLLEIDQSRRDAFATIGLQNNQSTQRGFGDVELYARIWRDWDYTLKCRNVFAGFSLGVLIPSGEKRNENAPASIPFGGDGHWGFFAQVDGLFEIKEDIKVGGFVGLRKRFSKTRNRRIPLGKEPNIFAPITGSLDINPGITFIASPYIVLENLRKGFGLVGQYTIVVHEEDEWTDNRSDKDPSSRLIDAIEKTEWATDYITMSAFYDFGVEKVCRTFNPLISVRWDFPVMFFISKRAPKTHRVSIGIEFSY